MFFDMNKASMIIEDQTDNVVKSTCCTAYADATCGFWPLRCSDPDNHYTMASTAAAANDEEVNGVMTGITQDQFDSVCCVARATCSSYSCTRGTRKSDAASRLCDGGLDTCNDDDCCDEPMTCDSDGEDNESCADGMFLDHKLKGDAVLSSLEESVVNAACCTSFADRVCKHYDGTCPDDKYEMEMNPLPGPQEDDGSYGMPTTGDWEDACCEERDTCEAFACGYGTLKANPETVLCPTGPESCSDDLCCEGDDMMCADYVASSMNADGASSCAIPVAGLMAAAAAGLHMN